MTAALGPIIDANLLMDFAARGGANLRVTQNEVVADPGMADAIWEDLVDLNQHLRVLVLGALHGVRAVVLEWKVALAETWKGENTSG